ncbi:M48 family metalloprotease [bacterium]|nr:M48 family metalloprotease [bacterium]
MKLTSLKSVLAIILISLVFTSACKKKEDKPGKGLNFFSLEDDRELGKQVAAEIESDSSEYDILDSASNVAAYGHIYRIRDSILNSGEVIHKDDFIWRIRIIENDSVLNAFCTPGGYIYVFTGLIKFLDAEYELAGVMAHEIAHADERHSTEAMTKAYGIEVIFGILLGTDQGAIAEVAKGLINLSYSRDNESEADMRSVEYLYPTAYDARGAAKFFEKMLALGANGGPQFLSTHPNPENRVEAINAHWEALGGKVGETYEARYQQFKNTLP